MLIPCHVSPYGTCLTNIEFAKGKATPFLFVFIYGTIELSRVFSEEPFTVTLTVVSAPATYSSSVFPVSSFFDGSSCDIITSAANYAVWKSGEFNLEIVIKIEPKILLKEIIITNTKNAWAKDRNTKGIRLHHSEDGESWTLLAEGELAYPNAYECPEYPKERFPVPEGQDWPKVHETLQYM